MMFEKKNEKNKWISVFPLPHSITLALLVVCLSVLLCDYNILLLFHLITKPYFSYEIKIDAYFVMQQIIKMFDKWNTK